MSKEKLRAVLAEIASALIKPQPPASTATMETWRDRQLERFRRKGEEALALLDEIEPATGGDDRSWRPIDDAARSGQIIEVLVKYNGGDDRQHLVLTVAYFDDFSLIDDDGDETGSSYLAPLAWRPAADPVLPDLSQQPAPSDEAISVTRVAAFDDEGFEMVINILTGSGPVIKTASIVASVKAAARARGIIYFQSEYCAQLARDILAGNRKPEDIDAAFIFANTAEGEDFWYETAASGTISAKARLSLERALRVYDATKEAS